MADQLQSVVQRMIDAGESEENIAAVIKHYNATAVSSPSPLDMLSGKVRVSSDAPAGTMEQVNEGLQSMAHPQSLGEMSAYLLPQGIGGAIGAAKAYGTAAQEAVATAPRLRDVPKQMFGVLRQRVADADTSVARGADMYNMRRAPISVDRTSQAAQTIGEAGRAATEVPIDRYLPNKSGAVNAATDLTPTTGELPQSVLSQVDRYMPNKSGVVAGPTRTVERVPYGASSQPASVATEAASGGSLSVTERATLAKQGYAPETIAKIEQLAQQQPVSGRLAMNPELQQPRIATGAEKVGREMGLSKEAVRQQTNPILGEAPGEASPIFPRETLGKIVDAVKALPVSEREAYVARATSGKAQWQIENIRRTLEHLGLMIPAAIGIEPAVRERLQSLMHSGSQ